MEPRNYKHNVKTWNMMIKVKTWKQASSTHRKRRFKTRTGTMFDTSQDSLDKIEMSNSTLGEFLVQGERTEERPVEVARLFNPTERNYSTTDNGKFKDNIDRIPVIVVTDDQTLKWLMLSRSPRWTLQNPKMHRCPYFRRSSIPDNGIGVYTVYHTHARGQHWKDPAWSDQPDCLLVGSSSYPEGETVAPRYALHCTGAYAPHSSNRFTHTSTAAVPAAYINRPRTVGAFSQRLRSAVSSIGKVVPLFSRSRHTPLPSST